MVSNISQLMQDGQDLMYEDFGISATYNGSTITVCVNNFDTTVEQYPEVWAAAAIIEVRKTEIAQPVVGDIVNFDGVAYQVGDILFGDELSWTMALTKEMVRL